VCPCVVQITCDYYFDDPSIPYIDDDVEEELAPVLRKPLS